MVHRQIYDESVLGLGGYSWFQAARAEADRAACLLTMGGLSGADMLRSGGFSMALTGGWRMVLDPDPIPPAQWTPPVAASANPWFTHAVLQAQESCLDLEKHAAEIGLPSDVAVSIPLGGRWRLVGDVEPGARPAEPSAPGPGFFRAGMWGAALSLVLLAAAPAGAEPRVYRDAAGRVETRVFTDPNGREVRRGPDGRIQETRQGGVRRGSDGRRIGTIEGGWARR